MLMSQWLLHRVLTFPSLWTLNKQHFFTPCPTALCTMRWSQGSLNVIHSIMSPYISSFYELSEFFLSLVLCLSLFTHAVHQWNQSYFMPSPPSTTCFCTKRGPRWRCVLLMACRGWFPYWKRVTPSSWPSPRTACSCCPTATRRAKWGEDLRSDIVVVVSTHFINTYTPYFLFLVSSSS